MNNSTYTVTNGDTLYGIAKRFNTSVQMIKELNNLSSNTLSIGQNLIVMKNVDNENNVKPENCITYTVIKGDNLYNIAKKYGTTVDEIKRENNITSNNLSIGQKIMIPCHSENIQGNNDVPSDYISYVVKRGDNLYDIAASFGTTVDQIKIDNNLTTNIINIGDILIIRNNNKNESIIEECYGESYIPEEYITYIVKRGDNLYDIAKNYGTSIDEIKRINNLNSNFLSINQELLLPQNNESLANTNITYTIQKGDSLYSISKKFNTTVADIQKINGLNTNKLSVGDKLIIPNNSNTSSNLIYIVKKGDSLYSIAKQFNTSVDNIKRKNNLTNNLLSIGQNLII